MGFFSWKTADTGESIANSHSPRCKQRAVFLLQPDGEPPVEESWYAGYGMFGEVDAYEWLAERNGGGDRGVGIDLFFREDPDAVPLKFSFDPKAVYEDLPASESCEFQGYFYPELEVM